MNHSRDDERDVMRYRFVRNKMALTKIICGVVTDMLNDRIRHASAADTNKAVAAIGEMFDSEVDKMIAAKAEAKAEPWK